MPRDSHKGQARPSASSAAGPPSTPVSGIPGTTQHPRLRDPWDHPAPPSPGSLGPASTPVSGIPGTISKVASLGQLHHPPTRCLQGQQSRSSCPSLPSEQNRKETGGIIAGGQRDSKFLGCRLYSKQRGGGGLICHGGHSQAGAGAAVGLQEGPQAQLPNPPLAFRSAHCAPQAPGCPQHGAGQGLGGPVLPGPTPHAQQRPGSTARCLCAPHPRASVGGEADAFWRVGTGQAQGAGTLGFCIQRRGDGVRRGLVWRRLAAGRARGGFLFLLAAGG